MALARFKQQTIKMLGYVASVQVSNIKLLGYEAIQLLGYEAIFVTQETAKEINT